MSNDWDKLEEESRQKANRIRDVFSLEEFEYNRKRSSQRVEQPGYQQQHSRRRVNPEALAIAQAQAQQKAKQEQEALAREQAWKIEQAQIAQAEARRREEAARLAQEAQNLNQTSIHDAAKERAKQRVDAHAHQAPQQQPKPGKVVKNVDFTGESRVKMHEEQAKKAKKTKKAKEEPNEPAYPVAERKGKGLLVTIVIFWAITALISLYLLSPLSHLGEIKITGNHFASASEIIEKSKINDDHYFLVLARQTQKFEKNIAQDEYIKSAKIATQLPNEFDIKIVEWRVLGVDDINGKYHRVLENGYMMPDEEDNNDNGFPVWNNFTSSEIMKKFVEQYNKLDEKFTAEIDHLDYTPSQSNKQLVTIYMKNGFQILVDIPNMVEKLGYYDQVVANAPEPCIIDMEVGIFTKPFPAPEPDPATDETTNTQENGDSTNG
ncbi:MAG: FtsQ-type POTRA domain-containing protein [Lactobacillales bacterium]|jgi:cell division protein FtsQ|nr:FtsQ-type POTRA domain-containing protein [Lactobacillales bacterium]